MTMRSWIRSQFNRPATRRAPEGSRKRRRARLSLETLEDRAVPATFTVTNTNDDGSVGSLRWAVTQANQTAEANTVNFDSTVFNTAKMITLTGSQLELSNTGDTETITGPAAGVTVSGGGTSRVFQIDGLVTASISGLTITGGNAGYSSGGGLVNYGTATLSNCTVSGNSAGYSYGGGLFNAGTLALSNCTVSGNSAGTGGGISSGSYFNPAPTLTLTNCTVSGNSAGFAGGLYSGGTATLTNTIVAGQISGGDVNGALAPASSNNLFGGNPLLAPLGDYGGPTQTMALLPGSPAIDAGTSTDAPATDQRGLPRVGDVDIGAFESQGFSFSAVPGSTPQTAQIGSPFANPLAVNVTANNPKEPVDGGVVSFGAGRVGGATAILSASSAVIAGGQAAVTAVPNNAVGSYNVVASVPGLSPVSFDLTNAGPAFASLVVNTTSDTAFPGPGLLSLREAVLFANFDSLGISAITFDEHVFAATQKITLTGSELELTNTTETITIEGPGAAVTIDGGGRSRVFQVDAGVTASLSKLTLTGGGASNGGGLYNFGMTTLTNCTVTGNSASGNGGGLANEAAATLTLANCTVSANSANYNGGGLYNSGTLSLTNCTISGNTAIWRSGNSYLGGNGGGIWANNTTTLTSCTVSGNTALSPNGGGGGIYSNSTLTLNYCTISGNSATEAGGIERGGGIESEGLLTITNSTLSGNTVGNSSSGSTGFSSAIHTDGSLFLTNVTISGNTVNAARNFEGGAVGIGLTDTVTITNCTIADNRDNCVLTGGQAQAAGIANFFGNPVTLQNTIVATNTTANGANGPDIAGMVTANNCLIGNTNQTIFNSGSGNNFTNVDAMLAPLGSFGGPTQTMALLPGSPAIDAGTSGPGIPSTDQRGLGRVGAVDIGAFESQGFSLSAVPGSTPQTAQIGTSFANPLAVTVTANNSREPVDGGIVSFVAGRVGGATAILLASSVVIAGGQAAVTAAPNNAVGSYNVVASGPGLSPVSFDLTNDGPAFASLVVNTTSDAAFPGPGLLSLREAVLFASLDTLGISAITFDEHVFPAPKTITLTGSALELTYNTTETISIEGPGAGVTIDGGGRSRVFQIDAGVTASISGLTITGGNAVQGGGGLFNEGTVTLTNCTVSGDSAETGGGLYNNVGTATLTNCTVSDNTAAANGGGLLSKGGTATLTDCTVSDNTAAANGGGLYNGGTLTLTNCTVSGNSAETGGGLYSKAGTATLTNCTVSGNSASDGGGLDSNGGTATLTNCTVSGNIAAGNGGGLYNQGTATLTNCTVSHNTAFRDGGGLFTFGTVTLTNCTLSNNNAARFGGGLFVGSATATVSNSTLALNIAGLSGGAIEAIGSVTVTGSTLSGNQASPNGQGGGGGAIDNYGGGFIVTVGNTIIAGNSCAFGPDFSNGVDTLGKNLISNTDGSHGWIASDLTGTSAHPRNPLLGPLANNGGPTQTMALLPGSQAIDAGDNTLVPADITTDQRGFGPRIVNGTVDIGAYEVGAIPVPTFSALSSPTIVYGTATTTLTGHLGFYTSYPTGSSVSVTLNSVTLTATVDSSGNFTTTFDTSTLNVDDGPYPVTYAFAGTTGFLAASDTSTAVTVTKAHLTVSAVSKSRNFGVANPVLTATLSGFVGNDGPGVVSGAATLSTTATVASPVGTYPITVVNAGTLAAANYDFPSSQFVNGTLTVLPAGASAYILNATASGAVTASGNAVVKLPGGLYVDSSSASAINASGNAQVNVGGTVDVVGGVSASGKASVTKTGTPGSTNDPLAALPLPGVSGLTNYGAVSVSGNSSRTLSPGIYTSIQVSGNASVTLSNSGSGIYIIEGGGLSVSGNGSLRGSGVLIFNAGSSYNGTTDGGTFGSVALGGNGTISLSGMTSAPYAGVVIFQARDNSRPLSLGGNGAAGITSTIYAPSANAGLSGNAQINGSLIVSTLTVSGNAGAFQLAGGANSDYVASTNNWINNAVLTVAVQDDTGNGIDPNEIARLDDAMSYLNQALGSFGVYLSWAAPGTSADVHVHFASTTPEGDASAGVLGFTTAANDVYLVTSGWNFYTGSDPSQIGAGQYDFQTLATHELAHTVGLGESVDPSSVMYEYLAPGTVRRTFTDSNLALIDTNADRFMKAALPAVQRTTAAALSSLLTTGAPGLAIGSLPAGSIGWESALWESSVSPKDGHVAMSPGLDGDGSVLMGGPGHDLVISGQGRNLMAGVFGLDGVAEDHGAEHARDQVFMSLGKHDTMEAKLIDSQADRHLTRRRRQSQKNRARLEGFGVGSSHSRQRTFTTARGADGFRSCASCFRRFPCRCVPGFAAC